MLISNITQVEELPLRKKDSGKWINNKMAFIRSGVIDDFRKEDYSSFIDWVTGCIGQRTKIGSGNEVYESVDGSVRLGLRFDEDSSRLVYWINSPKTQAYKARKIIENMSSRRK